MLLQQMVSRCAKATDEGLSYVPSDPRGYAELRTEILAMDVRKAECLVLSSKNRAARLTKKTTKA